MIDMINSGKVEGLEDHGFKVESASASEYCVVLRTTLGKTVETHLTNLFSFSAAKTRANLQAWEGKYSVFLLGHGTSSLNLRLIPTLVSFTIVGLLES